MSNTNQSVCDNQQTFNKALENAAVYVENKRTPGLWFQMLSLGLFVIVLTYALLLAAKIQDPNDKIIHFVFAILFSPVYVISYIIVNYKK